MKRRDFLGTLGMGLGAAFGPGSLRVRSSQTYRRTAVQPDLHFLERWSWAMGQPVHLQLFADSVDRGQEAASRTLAELRRIEHRLSLFDDTSDLVELNRTAGRARLRYGGDIATVLGQALRFQRLTDGAFNPAVEPLMRAWGFHAPRSREPSTAELAEARAAVMAARIVLDRDRISLPDPSTRLDLGGIGVGYGLDRAAAVLRKAGIHRAFLDVSGDCVAMGSPPGEEEGWLVQIAAPDRTRPPIASLRIRDAALATSSNTQSVIYYGRLVRGHVMDPATGRPADALTQVTIIARIGIEADALSTAMLVSGKPVEGVLRYFKA